MLRRMHAEAANKIYLLFAILFHTNQLAIIGGNEDTNLLANRVRSFSGLPVSLYFRGAPHDLRRLFTDELFPEQKIAALGASMPDSELTSPDSLARLYHILKGGNAAHHVLDYFRRHSVDISPLIRKVVREAEQPLFALLPSVIDELLMNSLVQPPDFSMSLWTEGEILVYSGF